MEQLGVQATGVVVQSRTRAPGHVSESRQARYWENEVKGGGKQAGDGLEPRGCGKGVDKGDRTSGGKGDGKGAHKGDGQGHRKGDGKGGGKGPRKGKGKE